MTPPPPPPQMSEAPMNSALLTPPQRTRKHSQSHNQYSKSPLASPATSASSAASPTHVAKTQMMMSPRVRSRMDPYPRYSPRKRLSADYSDGTYSVGSGGESPRSEKGGWRIHAAVAGPFLTGPLAREFRAESFMSPRGKKKDEPDFDNNLGLLLFPVVPAFVPPAISPGVFQASMQPGATSPVAPSAQEAQPALSTTAPPAAVPYYPPQQTENADAAWDQSYAQSYQEEYHQHFYPAEGYQEENHYTAEQYGEYNYGSYEQHYGYEQQYNSTAAETYGYEQSYDGCYAQTTETATTEQVSYETPLPTNEAAFPPLPQAEPSSNQVAEAVVEATPVRRERAPSYADVVTGAAHVPPSPRKEIAKSPKKLSPSNVFEDMTAGMAESMSTMLTKAKGGKTHSEVEFACVIHKISTQLKLMGKVSSSLKMEQMKALQKLEKVEAEKMNIQASNAQMAALLKQYEQEREHLKLQLAEALEAKETRLKDAVLSLTLKMDSLKNSKLTTEIEAIRKCGSSEDLEKRVEEIGAVLDHLIANHNTVAPVSPEKVARRPSGNAVRRQSVGSWKAVAMYALVVLAASLCGVWVGVKYVGQQAQQAVTSQPLTLSDAELDLIVARLSAKFPALETNPSEIAEAVKEAVAPAQQPQSETVAAVTDVVEVAVASDTTMSTVEVSDPVIEVTREQVSQPTSSSVAQVLYSWRPALFDLPTAADDASALNGLARALTSLSSQILADHDAAEASVFEVVEEPVSVPVEEPTQAAATVEEVAVPEVEATVEELLVIASPVEVAATVVEKGQYTNVTEPYSWELTAEELVFSPVVEEPVAAVEEPVAVVEAPREVVIDESVRPTRWVVDQLLIEAGVNSGASAAPVEVEEVTTPVIEIAPVEEIVQVAEPVFATEWALPVQPVLAEAASVKEVQVQFSNVSSVVATEANVVVDDMCGLPVVDLRSL